MSDTQPENPKHYAGAKKVSYAPVPAQVEAEIGLGMSEGARKYGRHNFRVVGYINASDYYDSMRRHLAAWWEGEDIDPDSGLHHLIKLITSAIVVRDSMYTGRFKDDRPPKLPEGWEKMLNAHAIRIAERYPSPKPASTNKESE